MTRAWWLESTDTARHLTVQTKVNVIEFRKEQPVLKSSRKEMWQGLAIWAFSMALACVLTYLMYQIGAHVWHGLVAIGSKLEELL